MTLKLCLVKEADLGPPWLLSNCVLKFASWAYDGTKIDIILNSEKGDETNFMTSTEWHLNLIRAEKNYIIYSCCPEPYPFVDVHISIQRRPMFYVFNLILPCVLISAIALLGFYMPSDSGEKVTLGITSLLSTTVFLMLVAEGMPPTSEALPLIGIYYGVTIFIVSLATAMTVFTVSFLSGHRPQVSLTALLSTYSPSQPHPLPLSQHSRNHRRGED
ncbi:unnamed protein product [Toxocara canis]|uniref:CHRNA10 n=1 Tax=Toxocara canis TaxID=6265 RepID=A0A183VC53_TOXCA|nr:unnamed protein product [Toxocara canis]